MNRPGRSSQAIRLTIGIRHVIIHSCDESLLPVTAEDASDHWPIPHGCLYGPLEAAPVDQHRWPFESIFSPRWPPRLDAHEPVLGIEQQPCDKAVHDGFSMLRMAGRCHRRPLSHNSHWPIGSVPGVPPTILAHVGLLLLCFGAQRSGCRDWLRRVAWLRFERGRACHAARSFDSNCPRAPSKTYRAFHSPVDGPPLHSFRRDPRHADF